MLNVLVVNKQENLKKIIEEIEWNNEIFIPTFEL